MIKYRKLEINTESFFFNSADDNGHVYEPFYRYVSS